MKKIILIALTLPFISLAIGQLTEPIVVENALRGQEIFETLTLYNSGDSEEKYGLLSEGDIAGWASFYNAGDANFENPVTEILIPAKSNIEATVQFKVPEETPNGDYFGNVVVMSLPKEETKEEGTNVSVSVFQRVGREVSITVTDIEITNLEATLIPSKYAISKNDSLKIKAIYENKGNIAVKPELSFKVLKDDNVIFNAVFPYPENEEAVKPFERKEIPEIVEWHAAGQEKGVYRAELLVLLNDETIKERSFTFHVGTDIRDLLLAKISVIGGGNLILSWLIIAGFLLVIAVVLTLFYKKSKLLGFSK